MPKKKDHLNKAAHDESFASSLNLTSTPYLDWVSTGLFYAALHYVEAYFATKNVHSPDHRTRDSSIRRDPAIGLIFTDFSELKNFSINARYYLYPFKPADVAALQRRLANLKSHILRLL